jgi:hypothetical protein
MLVSFLTDLYVERMRFEAIKCISKSYRPTVPVVYIARILGFLLNGDDRLEECEIWLKAHGAILSLDNSGELQIDTKVMISLSLSLSLDNIIHIRMSANSFYVAYSVSLIS